MKEVTKSKKKRNLSVERIFIKTLTSGQSFLSEKKDSLMTSWATIEGKKIKTERLLLVQNAKIDPTVKVVVRVTIL